MTLPITTHTLHVPGARLHYEVRGAGPVVLVIGSPMASAEFAPLADALATDHTVVTYDPRGIAASSIDDPSRTPPLSCAPTMWPRCWMRWAPSPLMSSDPAAAR